MPGPLTILWTTALDEEQGVLQEAAKRHEGKLLAVTLDSLAGAVSDVLAQGPVVVVTAGGSDATFAFRLGVDAVIYAGHVTMHALERTIQRARARARMRQAYRYGGSPLDGDISVGLTLLASALEHELCDPLLKASLKCKELTTQIQHLYQATDRLEQWAATLSHEPYQPGALRHRSPERTFQATIHEVQTAVHRADALISLMSELCGGFQPDLTVRPEALTVSVPETLTNLRGLVSGYVGPLVTFVVRCEGDCIIRMPRASFTCMIGALIMRAVEAIRATDRPGTIELRAFDESDQEGTVVVEIQDTGEPASSDFGPEVLHPHFRIAPGSPALISIRERARQFGGDLLLQAVETGTVVRLCLPSADSVGIAAAVDESAKQLEKQEPLNTSR